MEWTWLLIGRSTRRRTSREGLVGMASTTDEASAMSAVSVTGRRASRAIGCVEDSWDGRLQQDGEASGVRPARDLEADCEAAEVSAILLAQHA